MANENGNLREAEMEQSLAKVGAYGRQGSGKTSLLTLLAIGTVQRFCKGLNGIAFYDSEAGSDFMIPICKAEGIKLYRRKSRTLVDLLAFARHVEETKNIGALVVDSITHPWNDLMESLRAKLGVKKLAFHHFNEIKDNWKPWPNFYLNSRLHIFVAGRLGFEWVAEEDEETGKKEFVRGDDKMKVEVDFGHEPNLLLRLEGYREDPMVEDSPMIHHVRVLKDRTWAINGKGFEFRDQPSYVPGYAAKVLEPFLPHYAALNIGGQHFAFDPKRNSQELFSKEGKSEYTAAQEQKKIALEEIENTLVLLYPGTDQKSKRTKLLIVEKIFGVRAWAAVEAKRLEEIQFGLKVLRKFEGMSKQVQPETEDDFLILIDAAKDLMLRQPEPVAPAPADEGLPF